METDYVYLVINVLIFCLVLRHLEADLKIVSCNRC